MNVDQIDTKPSRWCKGATGNAQLSGAICGIFAASHVLRSRFPCMGNDNRRLNIRHHGVDARFTKVSRANSKPDWNILIAKQTSTGKPVRIIKLDGEYTDDWRISKFTYTCDYHNNCWVIFFFYIISRMKLNLRNYLCWYIVLEKIV